MTLPWTYKSDQEAIGTELLPAIHLRKKRKRSQQQEGTGPPGPAEMDFRQSKCAVELMAYFYLECF
jgi:hypothetical protein